MASLARPSKADQREDLTACGVSGRRCGPNDGLEVCADPEHSRKAQGAAAWIGDEPYISDAAADAHVRATPRTERFVDRHSSHPRLVRDPEPEMVERIKEFARTPA